MAGDSQATTTTAISEISSGSKVQDPVVRDALTNVKEALTSLNTRVMTVSTTFTSTVPGTLLTYIEELRVALVAAGVLRV